MNIFIVDLISKRKALSYFFNNNRPTQIVIKYFQNNWTSFYIYGRIRTFNASREQSSNPQRNALSNWAGALSQSRIKRKPLSSLSSLKAAEVFLALRFSN
jgi:hypothetical protein